MGRVLSSNKTHQLGYAEKIARIFREPNAQRFGLLIGGLYFLFYLYLIGNIAFGKPSGLTFEIIEEWPAKVFKPIAPWVWEPIARMQIDRLTVFLSIPNLVTTSVLSVLVVFNIAIATYSYRLSRVCQIQPGFKGILGFLPSLFTGFACCVPTFLIALGPALASFTVLFIELRPFLIPASVVLMLIGLKWSLDQIPPSYMNLLGR